MKLSLSNNANPNYVCKLVELGEPVKHPNADRLQGFIIGGNRIWTDMSRVKGQLGVYFPLECALSSKLLRNLNLYQDSTLNKDPEVKGYFPSTGRVKAVRLRQEPSEGFFLTLEEFLEGLEIIPKHGDEVEVDTIFDTVNGELIVYKYVIKDKNISGVKTPKQAKKTFRIVEGQFTKHEDTSNLRDNMHKISPEDMITISYKLHGTSFIVGNIPVYKKLKWYEKILKKIGINIITKMYKYIHSSRNVIFEPDEFREQRMFYGYNVYDHVKDALLGKIPKGYTLYGELVGYNKHGVAYQKDYDYGFEKPLFEGSVREGHNFGVFVYRIKFTNLEGISSELSMSQIKEFCDKRGIKHVPILYQGTLGNWSSNAVDSFWHINTLDSLKKLYLEGDCTMCKNHVPAEGVVIRKERLEVYEAYKLKSFRFLEKESKALDKGESTEEEISIDSRSY